MFRPKACRSNFIVAALLCKPGVQIKKLGKSKLHDVEVSGRNNHVVAELCSIVVINRKLEPKYIPELPVRGDGGGRRAATASPWSHDCDPTSSHTVCTVACSHRSHVTHEPPRHHITPSQVGQPLDRLQGGGQTSKPHELLVRLVPFWCRSRTSFGRSVPSRGLSHQIDSGSDDPPGLGQEPVCRSGCEFAPIPDDPSQRLKISIPHASSLSKPKGVSDDTSGSGVTLYLGCLCVTYEERPPISPRK
jgi:hypothetical protein